MADDSGDHPGYKRPPAAGQFRPGLSGNPRGRPKGSKNFATAILAELQARILVNENGRRKTITKREAIAKQLVNKAAGGDPRVMPLLLSEMRLHETQSRGELGQGVFGTPEDHRVMASIVQRIRNATSFEAGGTATDDVRPLPDDPDCEGEAKPNAMPLP